MICDWLLYDVPAISVNGSDKGEAVFHGDGNVSLPGIQFGGQLSFVGGVLFPEEFVERNGFDSELGDTCVQSGYDAVGESVEFFGVAQRLCDGAVCRVGEQDDNTIPEPGEGIGNLGVVEHGMVAQQQLGVVENVFGQETGQHLRAAVGEFLLSYGYIDLVRLEIELSFEQNLVVILKAQLIQPFLGNYVVQDFKMISIELLVPFIFNIKYCRLPGNRFIEFVFVLGNFRGNASCQDGVSQKIDGFDDIRFACAVRSVDGRTL